MLRSYLMAVWKITYIQRVSEVSILVLAKTPARALAAFNKVYQTPDILGVSIKLIERLSIANVLVVDEEVQ